MGRYLGLCLATVSGLALTAGAFAKEADVAPAGAAALRPNDDIRLRQALTVKGILSHEKELAAIAKKNKGNRAAGTKGYEASIKYVSGKLKKAGYTVKTQTFDYVGFEETGLPTLSRVTPNPTTFTAGEDFVTFTYSGSGSTTGQLVPTNDIVIPPTPAPSSTSGCEATDFPSPPSATAIALIQRGGCDFVVKAQNALAAGYAGGIVFNEGQPGRQDLFGGTLGQPVDIPIVSVSFALGSELFTAAKAGQVTMSLSTSTVSTPGTTKNIIADYPGGNANRVIVVGAHLDSVPEGPGINDNGSGTSTNLETALQIAKLNLKLRNKLRFAFWGAEELGLFGSNYYVANLPEEELAKIELNLNFDMLGSPNFVRFVYDGDGSGFGEAGPAGSDLIEQAFTNYFDGQSLNSEPTAFDGRSDYSAFILNGIPAGGLFSGAEEIKTAEQQKIYGGKAGVAYDSCYHQKCDNIDNLSTKALDQLGDAVASSVITFANRQQPLVAATAARASSASKASSFLYAGPKLKR